MCTLRQLSRKAVVPILPNSPGKITMLPHQVTSQYVSLSNFTVCERRTRTQACHLLKTADLLQIYNRIIREQEKRGFIKKIDSPTTEGPVHHNPHHHVSKDSKTTPIKIVYDSSCKLSGNYPSLNDCLEIGPSPVNDLCSVLLQFHIHKFALSTDIEKAFLHVKLLCSDQDFTRFLGSSRR